MVKIEKNMPPTLLEVEAFVEGINFKLPIGFIDFFKEANGADIISDEKFIFLWPLTDMANLNKDYNVDEYAPEFFIFGSNGGDTAYAIKKETGHIYEMPFIGMSKEEAVIISTSFTDFIQSD